jgi:hypothetical protein
VETADAVRERGGENAEGDERSTEEHGECVHDSN